MTKEKGLLFIKEMLFVTLGVFLLALPVQFLFGPENIIAGGISGLGIIVESVTGLDYALFVLISNTILSILGFILIGKEFALKSIFAGMVLFPFFLGVIPQFELTSDLLLASIIAGAMTGVGVNFVFQSNSSTGGTAALGRIISKYSTLTNSTSIALCDFVVVVIGLIYTGLESTMYALVSIVMMQVVANYLETGAKRSKVVYIITDLHDEIKADILNVVHRGVTVIPAYGGYTNKEKEVLMCVVQMNELKSVRKIVEERDGNAFLFITSASSAYGEGFISFNQSK